MTTSSVPIQLKKLYETDENLWLEEMIKLLRENRLEELDIDNLIEELESLSKRDKNRVVSLLRQIIIHLLLLEYWQEEYQYNHRHWQGELANFRVQLHRSLTTNLKQYLLENKEEIYQEAVFIVIQKTGLKLETFLINCPYTLEELLDQNYLTN
ncbi:MAG TPA: DUF29 domain-containing protein [Cyanothece sp. UBA12306]|nr:DUF29 domain-containing protein [Cyanothece sp. UBA12306]